MLDFVPHDERIKIELNVYEELSISVFKISRAVDSIELIVGLILASKFFQMEKYRVCKIICVNHHRLFDTPVFCIMHNGFDNTVISWKKLVE